MSTKKQTFPWTFNNKEIFCLDDMPAGAIGFVYRITNLKTKKYYIGKRTVAGIKKKKLTKKEKQLEENKRKTFKYIFCESVGWKDYCGSNKILKSEFEAGHKVKKEILKFCFTKSELSMEETREIICGGVLEDQNSYNEWVSCKIMKKNLLK